MVQEGHDSQLCPNRCYRGCSGKTGWGQDFFGKKPEPLLQRQTASPEKRRRQSRCKKTAIQDSVTMRVFILTEGGLHIGFGHVTRCLAIYDAFREKKIDPLLAVNGDETVAHLMNGTIGKICTNWVYEPEALLDYMRNADIAVVDSYLADQEFYRRISETVRTTVYFDDTMRINYPRGIVINGNICAEELNYPQRKDITYLLGSQYVPLRKEFWDVPEKKIRRSIKTVMITFGGNDIRNLTPWVLKTLK